MKNRFTLTVVKWFKEKGRELPWRGSLNPYVIWISEIILQQTRVKYGLSYFNRIIEEYPTIQHLASTDEDKFLKIWQGLGYYSRARHLLESASYIVNELNGEFPTEYSSILNLKGVGPYTAAAIASTAFAEPVAVLDGNVFRLLSRYFYIDKPIDNVAGQKIFKKLANELIAIKNPGEYNQAIMDFGALICKVVNPKCDTCPLEKHCLAKKKNRISQLPVRSKRIKIRDRYFNFLVIKGKKGYYITKRKEKDIWRGLYQFPMIETSELVNEEELINSESWGQIFTSIGYRVKKDPLKLEQKLTHQKINGSFWEVEITDEQNVLKGDDLIEANWEKIKRLAVPKIVDCYLLKI